MARQAAKIHGFKRAGPPASVNLKVDEVRMFIEMEIQTARSTGDHAGVSWAVWVVLGWVFGLALTTA
jgi:hypothetical protein